MRPRVGSGRRPRMLPDLILRIKEDYDGAEPSGNSVACLAFLKLGRMADRSDLVEAAQRTLALFSARLEQLPQAVPFLLQALDFSLQEPVRAVVVGKPQSAGTRDLLAVPSTPYISPIKLCWGIADRSSPLPKRCQPKLPRLPTFARERPVNRPQAIRILLRSCCVGEAPAPFLARSVWSASGWPRLAGAFWRKDARPGKKREQAPALHALRELGQPADSVSETCNFQLATCNRFLRSVWFRPTVRCNTSFPFPNSLRATVEK